MPNRAAVSTQTLAIFFGKWIFFPTVSHREYSACLIDNKKLAMLYVPAFKDQLHFRGFFSQGNRGLFSYSTIQFVRQENADPHVDGYGAYIIEMLGGLFGIF